MEEGNQAKAVGRPWAGDLWPCAGLILLLTALFVTWLLVKPGTHGQYITGDNIAQCLLEGTGVLLALPIRLSRRRPQGLDNTGRQRGRRWAPYLLALGIFSYALGQIIWTLNEDLFHLPALFPSWADAGYLGAYPALLLAILLLPARPISLTTRTRVVLDGLMIMAGVVTFSWYFVLGPTVLQDGQPVFVKVVSTAYPLCDLLLVTCLLLLAARSGDRVVGPVVGVLALALGIIVTTDSIYDYQNLHNAYATGGLLDLGWPLGFMLVGLGARAMRVMGTVPGHAAGSSGTPTSPARIPLWRSLLPYAFIPAVGLLVLYTWHPRTGDALDAGVLLGAVALIALVVVRQFVALRELHLMYTSNDALTAANVQLEVMATTDALTGLPNRIVLRDRLEQALRLAARMQHPLAVLLLDLDRFKEVNDTFGHQYGDMLLQQIGPRLRGALRASDTVARLGGDEFAVLLPGTDAAGAAVVARTLVSVLDAPFHVDGQALSVGVSIGIALSPDHGDDASALLRCVDVAMYVAKRTHSGYAVYSSEVDQHSPRRLALMSELRQAIEQDGLLLYYQPKVSLATGDVCGVEALLRWPHPEHGFIAPDYFIPLAEHTGLIAPLTEWVLHRALHQCRAWQRAGFRIGMAVNLSMSTLHNEHFPHTIATLLRQCDVAPQQLTLEITESAVMADPKRAISVITRLGESGVRVAIDDFGTGYSSLGYLKQLPVQEIKIDKSFVLGLGTGADATDVAIVQSVITLAHALQREVVAEGVESSEAWEQLRSMGCDTAQGYYLSRPLPATDLERWLRASPHRAYRASA